MEVNIYLSPDRVRIFLSDFNLTLVVSTYFSVIPAIKFQECISSRSERTDMTELRSLFSTLRS
jgi:hypothetical protein